MVLQSEMNSMQSRARDMMVCQGAEVSSAAVSLANLSMRLQTLIGKLVQDYSITDSDIEVSHIHINFLMKISRCIFFTKLLKCIVKK